MALSNKELQELEDKIFRCQVARIDLKITPGDILEIISELRERRELMGLEYKKRSNDNE